MPEPVESELISVRQLAYGRNQRIKDQLEEIITVLNHDDIQPLLLKGASYLMQPAAQIQYLRMTSDIDLLIRESVIEPAIKALNASGYEFSNFLPDGTSYHIDPLVKHNRTARLELHLEPLEKSARILINSTNTWDNAELIESNNLSYYILNQRSELCTSLPMRNYTIVIMQMKESTFVSSLIFI